MGKVEADSDWATLNPHYLPWHGHVTALTIAVSNRRLGLAQVLTCSLEHGCDQLDAWFIDLFVREGNAHALKLYQSLGYSIYRKVLGYYSDDPLRNGSGENAFDMRKSLSRDVSKRYERKNGKEFSVLPSDIDQLRL